MIKTVTYIFFYKMFPSRTLRFVMYFLLTLLFTSYAFADGPDDEYTEHCLGDNFNKKYDEADCWSCAVVLSLMQSMTAAAGTLYNSIREISILVLLYGGSIWIICYFIKSLGSFAEQNPNKILEGLINFMFKWALAYVMVYSGLDTIVLYIVDPLLDVGYTIGQSLSQNAGIGG
ncbi:MAG: hypothetical protein IKW39_06010 [Alphaproteobacteria bacterium]|nr:hypothetical protein [Alphaproteobacteria bacterium]